MIGGEWDWLSLCPMEGFSFSGVKPSDSIPQRCLVILLYFIN
jgi:hypothetical protein